MSSEKKTFSQKSPHYHRHHLPIRCQVLHCRLICHALHLGRRLLLLLLLVLLLNLNYFLFHLCTGICLGNLRENITLLPAASFFFFLFVTVSDHISRKPRCRFSAILPCSWRRNVAFYIEWLQKPLTTMFPVTETQSSTRPQRLLNV